MHRCNAHRAESPDSARGRSRLPSWRILTVPVCAGLVGTTAIIVACSEQGPTALRETAPRISSDFLAVSALQSVAPDGRFILKHSVLSPNIPEIDEDQARQLATAFVGHFAHFLVHALEKDRGGTISLSALTPCKRAFYAAGAYEALSPTTPAVIRKATGPQWIVPFCAGEKSELAVYGSGYATDA